MGQIKRKTTFEKLFKEAIYNFDPAILQVKWETRGLNPYIEIIPLNKEYKLHCYRGDIEKCKNYFIEFINTGVWDFNAYWELYSPANIASDDIGKIYKFPMKVSKYNSFDIHSTEMNNFLSEYREKYPNCGIRQVPKPTAVTKPKSYRFFFHYYKQYKCLSIHHKGKCHKVDNVIINVPTESKWNKRQPHLVVQGFCSQFEIKDNIAYVS